MHRETEYAAVAKAESSLSAYLPVQATRSKTEPAGESATGSFAAMCNAACAAGFRGCVHQACVEREVEIGVSTVDFGEEGPVEVPIERRDGIVAHRQEVVYAAFSYGARGQFDGDGDGGLALPVAPAVDLGCFRDAAFDGVEDERLV